jgi:hypothetical protein
VALGAPASFNSIVEPSDGEAGSMIGIGPAILAGISAAILSTIVEVPLWWAGAFRLPETLLRDARLTAAIVLGRDVLPPPSTFDWRVMIAATVVHFGLSIIYAAVIAATIDRLRFRPAIALGAISGLLLYVINMYGFTVIFPWFADTRGWITAAAHVTFGATAGAVYKVVQPGPSGRRS